MQERALGDLFGDRLGYITGFEPTEVRAELVRIQGAAPRIFEMNHGRPSRIIWYRRIRAVDNGRLAARSGTRPLLHQSARRFGHG